MEDKKKRESYEMNQALIERLRIAMERAQVNARELAENAEVGRSFVYDVLSGKSLNPTTHKLSAVANSLGVSMSYLLYGEESWGGSKHPKMEQKPTDILSITTLAIENSTTGATLVTEEREDKPFFFHRNWVKQKLNANPNDLRVVDVKGDSMSPTLSEGDTVLINLKENTPSPPGIFILFDGFSLVLKRLELQPDGTVQILSDNLNYAPHTRPLSNINIIGRVVWIGREL